MTSRSQTFVPTLRRTRDGWQLASGRRVRMTFATKGGTKDAARGVAMFNDLQEIDASVERQWFGDASHAVVA